jgi:hypothetical protein
VCAGPLQNGDPLVEELRCRRVAPDEDDLGRTETLRRLPFLVGLLVTVNRARCSLAGNRSGSLFTPLLAPAFGISLPMWSQRLRKVSVSELVRFVRDGG